VRTFTRAADGQLVVTFLEGHRTLLTMLLTEIRGLLRDQDGDARVAERLFPRAYLDPTEDVAEAEWQALVHDDLAGSKIAAFDAVLSALEGAAPDARGVIELRFGRTEEDQLLGALNDLRLALAELTGIDDTTPDPEAGDPAALDTAMVLDWLAELVSDLVELKLTELPD
jgi:hypothetical protein